MSENNAWRVTEPRPLPKGSMDWVVEAACSGHPLKDQLFFPSKGAVQYSDQAKEICARCPVRIECLKFSLMDGETRGLWGGLTEYEREHIPKGTKRSLSDLARVCPGCHLVRLFTEKDAKLCDRCRGITIRERRSLNRRIGS